MQDLADRGRLDDDEFGVVSHPCFVVAVTFDVVQGLPGLVRQQHEREQHHRPGQPLHLVPQRAGLSRKRDTQEGKHESQEADPDRL